MDTGYFPTVLNKAFIRLCLFGEGTEKQLLDGFIMYLSNDERSVITDALNSDDPSEIITSDDFMEIMEEYKCRCLVTPTNLKETIIELGRQELFQKPHIMHSCFVTTFKDLKKKISSLSALDTIYDILNPTNKKIVSSLQSTPRCEPERVIAIL